MTHYKDFITTVHERMEAFGTPLQAIVGRSEWSKHTSVGSIKWALGGIAWDAPDTIDKQRRHIVTRVQSLHVAIWCRTEDECSAALDNLIRSAILAARGRPNIDLSDFEWLTEEKPSWLDRGEVLTGTMTVRLQVSRLPTPHPLAKITSQEHTESLLPQG